MTNSKKCLAFLAIPNICNVAKCKLETSKSYFRDFNNCLVTNS